MAKLLSLDAYIARTNTHENVESLGKWTFGVCVDTGISTLSGHTVPKGNYDFFVGAVDDIYMFGGAMQSMGTEEQASGIQTLKQYVPAITEHAVSSAYNTSDYELKLVNAAGDFAVKKLRASASAGMYELHKSDGTLIYSGIALSGSVFSLDNNNTCWGGLIVSGFADDGKFSKTAKYYGFTINNNRYWDFGINNNFNNDGVIDFLNNIKAYETPSTDPYEKDPGGTSGTGGGTGNFDGTGDDIDFPSLPTLSAVDTGFITLFNPTASQLKNLANYMWGDLFDLNTWKKIFADPMDAILGMSIVPVAVPDGGESTVTVGNISTGVSMNRAARQYVEVDCGTLNVNEYWGAYLDYDPFTKAEIYLPYIGIHPLATDDIMNKPVHVKYHIDILSGACCAYVKCGGSVMYSFVGQCSCSIPITGNDWSNVVNGALSIAASIGTMVATGGASAPMAAATIASTAVNSMKPSVEKSGSMGGMGGMLGVQTPYLILTRPRQALPARQNEYTGYPSFITMSLGDCSGYTEIEKVHLKNLSATEQELSEIENLLKGGVIF